jgi:tetratricopeptide (TPR) repeat protein
VAGRGPLALPEEVAAPAALVLSRPAPVLVAAGGPPPPPPPPPESNGSSEAPTAILPPPPPPPPPARGSRLPAPLRRAARPLLALAVIVAALLCAFEIWQPLRADQETDHALDLAAAGKTSQALAAVDRARDWNPLTPRSYVIRSSIEDGAGHPDQARRTLEDAVRAFSGDPQVWIQLAQYELNTLNRPADALAIIRAALYLDPQSRAAQTVFFQANALLHPPPPPPPAPAPVVAPAPAPAPSAQPQAKPPAGGGG